MSILGRLASDIECHFLQYNLHTKTYRNVYLYEYYHYVIAFDCSLLSRLLSPKSYLKRLFIVKRNILVLSYFYVLVPNG